MDKKTAICQYLKKYHTGGERAVYSRELQRLFSIDGRGLRRKINSLRQDGYPICSDERDYYYSFALIMIQYQTVKGIPLYVHLNGFAVTLYCSIKRNILFFSSTIDE